MTLISPGDWDPETGIADNPAFSSRAVRKRPSREQRLFASAVYAAEQVDRAGLAICIDTIRGFNPELPVAFLAELLPGEKFQHALTERGIKLPSESGLSPEQMAAAAIYMDMTVPMTHYQKLKAAGVGDAKWRGWMRQPRFAEYVSTLSEESLRSAVPVASQRLAQLVDDGNLKAIELVYEITGRHDRRKESLDVNKLLLAVFTVLDEEISPLPGGVGVLQRINDKVKRMMGDGQAPTLQITEAPPAN